MITFLEPLTPEQIEGLSDDKIIAVEDVAVDDAGHVVADDLAMLALASICDTRVLISGKSMLALLRHIHLSDDLAVE